MLTKLVLGSFRLFPCFIHRYSTEITTWNKRVSPLLIQDCFAYVDTVLGQIACESIK